MISLRYEDSFAPKVETTQEEWNNSIMRNVYSEALEAIKGITDIPESKTNNQIESPNLIGLLGDRGTGKSSVLNTISSNLTNEEGSPGKNGPKYEFIKNFGHPSLTAIRFFNLEIDPNLFSGKESILEVLVSKLFNFFSEKTKVDSKRDKTEEINKIYTGFQSVMRGLSALKKGTEIFYPKDSDYSSSILEDLSYLAIGPQFRTKLEDLVGKVLEFCNAKNDTLGYFLVSIDDLDLASVSLNVMLENIRKYLSLPNVIILLGARMDQLLVNIELQFQKEFAGLANGNSFESPKGLARKYLEKLLPINRRIRLPELAIGSDEAFQYTGKDGMPEDFPSLLSGIETITFDKTGMAFAFSKSSFHNFGLYERHPFLPKNLRGLHTYLALLEDFQGVKGNKNEWQKLVVLRVNQAKFKTYLLSDWAVENLDYRYVKFLEAIDLQSPRGVNRYICTQILSIIFQVEFGSDEKITILNSERAQQLVKRLRVVNSRVLEPRPEMEVFRSDKQKGLQKHEFGLIDIVKFENDADRVSIGDVLYTLTIIHQNFPEAESIGNLVAMVRTLLSFKFWHLWTSIKQIELIPESEKDEKQITQEKRDSHTLRYFIGHSIYPPEALNLLRPSKKYPGRYRSHFVVGNIKDVTRSIPKENELLLTQIAQLFTLFGRYRADFREQDTLETSYSTNLKEPHNFTFAFFNLLAFPGRILSIWTSSSIWSKVSIDDLFAIPFYSLELLETALMVIKMRIEGMEPGADDWDHMKTFFDVLFNDVENIGNRFWGSTGIIPSPGNIQKFPPLKNIALLKDFFEAAYKSIPYQKDLYEIEKPEFTRLVNELLGFCKWQSNNKSIITKFFRNGINEKIAPFEEFESPALKSSIEPFVSLWGKFDNNELGWAENKRSFLRQGLKILRGILKEESDAN